MKILFLDLDGTVRETKSGKTFINDPEDQQLMKGVKEALSRYKDWLLIGVTNQGGVAVGHKSIQDAIKEQKITIELAGLDFAYFCPDYEGLTCYKVFGEDDYNIIKKDSIEELGSFRKPGAGMVNMAIKYLSPDECLMVGDRPEDEQCAKSAGIRFIPAVEWRVQTID
ncbi:HAD-IIIA family hydrolase [Aetokthonos hydrillicola Thurmond2011]|jgi:D-glycero-D-manno-heptose 1,7-bisphosphate phosphatase|uniref:HAD-IIIA family hydrolase n=1 Tax=Aetokthonos hydrillicola Thurmond2011 TaxID=2712845 RepID=A0AAP5IGN2_9CYAN|nr:HAD-IIIA family hydrolase [Aetokthonos hydrillicola]MBO3463670.1 HAD-IIIA family hydrolase [Aetokthonos hydrillicola CCALA 1050]MDR9900742.1 HAD-IIIA family hydrolase [Aetokthonos hydrillicola Thurmond2011]